MIDIELPVIEPHVTRLYRYQRFNEALLQRIVVEGDLPFSSPQGFNDPWDCRVWYDPDMSNPERMEGAVAYYINSTRAQAPTIPEDEIQKRAAFFRKNQNILADGVRKITDAMQRTIFERYAVCCFSAKPACELMWAHYASGHSGIFLEFDTRNDTFRNALKVTYQEKYPVVDIGDTRPIGNMVFLFTKSSAWAYEQEYRLIFSRGVIGIPLVVTDANSIALPDNALVSVIVGHSAASNTIDTVHRLIEQSGRPISVKRAVAARNQYKLEIV